LAAIAKGRTSSLSLQQELRPLCALLLAASQWLALAYVETSDDPADEPSRWGGHE
jgi:hypothetical protein